MSSLLARIDNKIVKISDFIIGISVVLMIAIVFLQVVFRYVLKLPLAGVEELPRYIMIACVYLGSGMLARDDSHIKIDFLSMITDNKKILHIVQMIIHFITSLSLGVFTYLSVDYVMFVYKSGDVSAGLGFPMWCITSFLIIGGLLMTMYYFSNFIKCVKELIQWQ